MTKGKYYSIRTGINQMDKLDLPTVLELFRDVYSNFEDQSYFRQLRISHTGDMSVYIFQKIHKTGLWPVKLYFHGYSKEDLFDLIEFLYDHISKPVGRLPRKQADFDQEAGRQEFRTEINSLLRYYEDGYKLSETGEIVRLPDSGLENLLKAQVPKHDPENVDVRIEAAIKKFRSFRSSLDDRQDAVRSLVDVLEFLRPKLKQAITSKDEGELFNIANNFGIRHHNKRQKTDYDKSIWYSWMFYYYLATIHASLRLIRRHEESGNQDR